MVLDRRKFLLGAGLTGLALKSPFLFANTGSTPDSSPITRKIPGTGEAIPAIGMGTWITFNVGGDPALVEQRTQVLKTFFKQGGTVVDGSPMYGTASDVVGEALDALGAHDRVFAATKIWTSDESATRQEAENRLLPLAREKGIAVIVNRPFQGGSLFGRYQFEPLPGLCKLGGCWACPWPR